MTRNIMGNNLGMVRNVNFEFTCLSDPPIREVMNEEKSKENYDLTPLDHKFYALWASGT